MARRNEPIYRRTPTSGFALETHGAAPAHRQLNLVRANDVKVVSLHGGKAKGDIRWQSARTFGWESNPTMGRLAKMNALCFKSEIRN